MKYTYKLNYLNLSLELCCVSISANSASEAINDLKYYVPEATEIHFIGFRHNS